VAVRVAAPVLLCEQANDDVDPVAAAQRQPLWDTTRHDTTPVILVLT
jgi:hypothetical protein